MTYGQAIDALADPTRRAVFERLAENPQSVGVLAEQFPVSRPAISQHLKILKQAGLVFEHPIGTRRVYAVDPTGLAELRAWLDRFWDSALSAYEGGLAKWLEEERKDD